MLGMISMVYAAGWRLAAFLVINGNIGILEVLRYNYKDYFFNS